MLTTLDLMKKFKVSRPTIRRWAEKGVIPLPKKLGGVVRWREEDIEVVEHPGRPQAAGANNG
jgi:excisionase family DNA binding protein